MRYLKVGVHIVDLIRVLSKGIEQVWFALIVVEARQGGTRSPSGCQSDLVWVPRPGSVPVNHSLPALQPKIQRSLCSQSGLSCSRGWWRCWRRR